MAERVPTPIDLRFEIAGLRRDPCRQLRHYAPGEVLEMAGPGVAGREDGRPESLDVALGVERKRPNVVGRNDPTRPVEDHDDAQIRQLVVARAGCDLESIADLLERSRPDGRREASPKRSRPKQCEGAVTERVEVHGDAAAIDGSEQVVGGSGGRCRRGNDQGQPMGGQDLDERRQLRIEDPAANQPGDPGGIRGGQDIHRRLRAEVEGVARAYSVVAMSAAKALFGAGRAADCCRNLTESGGFSCDDAGVTNPPVAATELTIVPLTADRLDDLATLFDQGGDPKWCWCAWYRVPNRNWSNATPTDNRALLADLATKAPAPGLVAYRGNHVVGWVSLGPRADYERLAHSTILAPLDDRPVWSIVCFVVGRPERGQGIARGLLDAAIEHARVNGATTLEAYPTDTGGSRLPAANVYKGTLSMFERAGFTVVARRQATATSTPRPIVRLEL